MDSGDDEKLFINVPSVAVQGGHVEYVIEAQRGEYSTQCTMRCTCMCVHHKPIWFSFMGFR